MLMTTTTSVEGQPVREYLGVVTGECIVGANIFKDLFAGIRDIVGGRAGAYENSLRDARQTEALAQAGTGQDPEAQQRWRSLHERRKELMAASAITSAQ